MLSLLANEAINSLIAITGNIVRSFASINVTQRTIFEGFRPGGVTRCADGVKLCMESM